MSGIINSAGSKSGVIGSTELDVEEGLWTPTSGGFDVSGSFTSGGKYVRIGKMVWVSGWVKGSTNISTSGSASTIGGALPFTIANGANTITSCLANSGQMVKHLYCWNNNIYTIYPNNVGNTTSANTNFSTTTDGINFEMQYEVA